MSHAHESALPDWLVQVFAWLSLWLRYFGAHVMDWVSTVMVILSLILLLYKVAEAKANRTERLRIERVRREWEAKKRKREAEAGIAGRVEPAVGKDESENPAA